MAERYPTGTNQDDGKINRTIVSRFTSSDRELAVPSTSQSVYNSSTFDINCDICSEEGEIKEAVGYCSNCKEHYCPSCLRAHRKSKASSDHTLLDQSTMPTVTTVPIAGALASMNLNKGSDTFNDQCSDEFHFNRDINIKFPDDKFDCFIEGMVAVSDRDIVLVDAFNISVKMIDVIDDVMKGYIAFNSDPYDVTSLPNANSKPIDVTTIPNAEVAVTFPDEKLIRILSTTGGGLAVKRTVKLNGWCIAVEYCNDKLYVSYQHPVKFQILSLSGGVKQTITPDAQFLEHCAVPRNIGVHPGETSIYVSDWKNNVVLRMDMSGVLLGVYKDVDLEKPHDITFTPFGSIYLCNREQHIVYKLTKDLGEASIVLSEQDGLRFPVAISFCHTRRYLLISSASLDPKFRNFIKLYKYN